MPQADSSRDLPNKEDLLRAAELAKAAKKAQQAADDLKDRAAHVTGTSEHDELLEESKKKEEEARSFSRKARYMASGAWQGAAAGAGVGAAVAGGLGTVVGTLVGTIAAIPTTGLGALIGIPVGFFHGPFVKGQGGKEGKDADPSEQKEMTEDEMHQAVIKAVDVAEEQEKGKKIG